MAIKKERQPVITVRARRVNCPCGYYMGTDAGLETARAHNKHKHGGKFQIFDVDAEEFLPQNPKKPKVEEKVEAEDG